MKLRRLDKRIYTYDKDGKNVTLSSEQTVQYFRRGRWIDLPVEYDHEYVDTSALHGKDKK